MLLSDMIQKLSRMRAEGGDTPLYFMSQDGTIVPIHAVWNDLVSRDDAKGCEELKPGQSISYIS